MVPIVFGNDKQSSLPASPATCKQAMLHYEQTAAEAGRWLFNALVGIFQKNVLHRWATLRLTCLRMYLVDLLLHAGIFQV